MERWESIHERPTYQVSDQGRVRNAKGLILKQTRTYDAYLKVSLGGKPKLKKFAHRLVACAFLENPESKPSVDHKNGNRGDNRAENLRWVTAAENNKHRVKPALSTNGGKRVIQSSLTGEVVKEWASIAQAARELGLQRPAISHCCHHRYAHVTCGGFLWEFTATDSKLEGEVWRTCPQFLDVEVSTEGRFRTARRGALTGSLISGYVHLRNCGVHRLVAATFPELCPRGEGQDRVNHKDGNRLNNRVSNLEWVTQAQNVQHAHATGLTKTKKAVVALSGTSAAYYSSISEASRVTGVAAANISRACRKRIPAARGSAWRYAEEGEEPAIPPRPTISDDDPIWQELGFSNAIERIADDDPIWADLGF